jgi:hypothetical protein
MVGGKSPKFNFNPITWTLLNSEFQALLNSYNEVHHVILELDSKLDKVLDHELRIRLVKTAYILRILEESIQKAYGSICIGGRQI